MQGCSVAGVVALGTLVAVFLIIEGVMEILLAFEFRPAKNWGWLLFSGIISVLLAILILSGWPVLTVLFLGLIIGTNLLFYGISLIALAASVGKSNNIDVLHEDEL